MLLTLVWTCAKKLQWAKGEYEGIKKTQRPKRILMDVMKEDLQRIAVPEQGVIDRVRWRQMTHCEDP